MDIVSQLLILSFAFAVGYGVVVAQVLALSRLFKSHAWRVLAVAFVLGGLLRLWGFIRLPAAILKAQAQGRLAPGLTAEQWITIAGSAAVIVLLIAGFDRLRRDLRAIGL